MKIVIASSNRGKIEEMRRLLMDLPVECVSQAEFGVVSPEETGDSFVANALLKARWAMRQTGLPAVADDSGLEVAALHGRPGIFSARYAGEWADDAQNRRKLLEELSGVPWQERKARFVCAIALTMPEAEDWTTVGYCEGFILSEERGQHGFGYDPLFYFPALQKTFAEMSEAEKNQVSHRGVAMRRLIHHLQATFGRV